MLPRTVLVLISCCLGALGQLDAAQSLRWVGNQGNGKDLVPTGQMLKPEGENIPFHGRPTDMAFSPDGKLLAVKHSHGLLIIDVATRKIVQELPMPDDK